MAFAVNGCAHGHACQGRSETLPQCPERLTSLFPGRIERNSRMPQRDCVDTINMLDEYGHFYTCLLNFPVGHLLVWMFPLSQVLEDVFLITRLLSFCALFWGKDSIPTWIPGASLVREGNESPGFPLSLGSHPRQWAPEDSQAPRSLWAFHHWERGTLNTYRPLPHLNVHRPTTTLK